MGKIKVFKRKSNYIYDLLFRLGVLSLTIWWFSWLNGYAEQELLEIFGEQDLIGSSGQRGAQVIQMLIVNKLGKLGMTSLATVFVIGALLLFINEFREFIRFLKKDKLYKQGLVNNLEDDYVPVSFFQAIRNFFQPKNKKTKEYPSEKCMRETLGKNKYFK